MLIKKEGDQAYRSGKSVESCPYNENHRCEEWMNGFFGRQLSDKELASEFEKLKIIPIERPTIIQSWAKYGGVIFAAVVLAAVVFGTLGFDMTFRINGW